MDSPDNSFYVGWGTLSLINANIAQIKGKSGLTWWFVSIFIGPIATFLLLLREKAKLPE